MRDNEEFEENMLNGDKENLPDRQSAERNSVYKLAGGDRNAEELKNLPDRESAERNSVYKIAREAQERYGGDKNPAQSWENNPNGVGTSANNPAKASEAKGFRNTSTPGVIQPATADGYSASSDPRADRVRDQHSGSRPRQTTNDKDQKENGLEETVTLNTDPIDVPSKLGNL